MAPAHSAQPNRVRNKLGISSETMGRLLGISSRTVQRWEQALPHRIDPQPMKRLQDLEEITKLGLMVYTEEGFQQFLRTPLREFDGKTALDLISIGDTKKVFAALATDYEGGWV